MISFTTASNHLFVSPYSATDLNLHSFPSWVSVSNSRTRPRKQELGVSFNLAVAAKEKDSGGSLLGFVDLKKGNYRGSCCFSLQKDWQSGGDLGLEAEILEFMKRSENPERFPSKKQLMDAGRMDLVEAITKQGGWLTFGWDLDDKEREVDESEVQYWDSMNVEDYQNCSVTDWVESGEKDGVLEGNEVDRYSISSLAVSSSGPASSSGRSLEAATGEDSGVEGILSRLEKERNIKFAFNSMEKGKAPPIRRYDHRDEWLAGTSKNMAVSHIGRSSRPASFSSGGDIINDAKGKPSLSDLKGLGNSLQPEMWRTWSSQRAGISNMELKAAEAVSKEEGPMNASRGGILEVKERCHEQSNGQIVGISSSQIKSRLQEMKSELSSALHSLRSNTSQVVLPKGYESSSEDLQKLYDAWEFQENEIMNAKDRLRSIRAKLAVLEGKMTLAMIDAQKMVKMKQKRIDDARRELRLIRTVCVVWPNLALEVLLVGSFDGWSSKRKMQKSGTGIFSLSLKLYPGKYEIKFIVDGEWRIDPLRPIVYNGGYENNLLMVM